MSFSQTGPSFFKAETTILFERQTGSEGTGPAKKIGQHRTFMKYFKMVKNSLYNVFDSTIVFSTCELVGMHLRVCGIVKFIFLL